MKVNVMETLFRVLSLLLVCSRGCVSTNDECTKAIEQLQPICSRDLSKSISCVEGQLIDLDLSECGLERIPENLSLYKNISSLKLTSNNISVLNTSSLKPLRMLRELYMSDNLGCYSSSINDHSFEGITGLSLLHLTPKETSCSCKDFRPLFGKQALFFNQLQELHIAGVWNFSGFEHLVSLRILNLGHSSCCINDSTDLSPLKNLSLERISFRNCTKISSLNISSTIQNITALDLSCLDPGFISYPHLDNIIPLAVQTLILDGYPNKDRPALLLRQRSSVLLLSLQNNLNRPIYFWPNISYTFPSLQFLSISHTRYTDRPIMELLSPALPNLEVLEASEIDSSYTYGTGCPDVTSRLFTADLHDLLTDSTAQSAVSLNASNAFQLAPRLHTIIANNNGGFILDFNCTFNGSALKRIISRAEQNAKPLKCLEGHSGLTQVKHLDCGSKACYPVTFPRLLSSFSGLQTLSLCSSEIKASLNNGSAVYPRMDSLTVLKLTHCNIDYISDASVFSFSPNLTHLDLYGNLLTTWNISVNFSNQLSIIDVTSNKIESMPKNNRYELDQYSSSRNFSFIMFGNTVPCDCSYYDFIVWINDAAYVKHERSMSCNGVVTKFSTWISSAPCAPPLPPSSFSPEVIAISVSLGLFAIIACVTGFIMYKRHRWTVRLWLYKLWSSHTQNLIPLSQYGDNESWFISFCDEQEDVAFLIHQFARNNPDLGINVLSRFDVSIGASTNRQLVQFIESCSAFVAIMPDNSYASCEQSLFELHVATRRNLHKVYPLTTSDSNVFDGISSYIANILKKQSLSACPSSCDNEQVRILWDRMISHVSRCPATET